MSLPPAIRRVRRARDAGLAAALLLTVGVAAGCTADGSATSSSSASPTGASSSDASSSDRLSTDGTIRVATFNVQELSAEKIDRVDAAGRGDHPQLRAAAAVIQAVRPDVLLLNEIDYDAERSLPRLFVERYLSVSQDGDPPLDFAHVVYEPVNTGVLSGHDLDDDGSTDGPGDAWGWGEYPGQYGMALLSRHPIDREGLRTFRELRWSAMPGHRMPDGRNGAPAWYEADEAAEVRLSSKSHWDVPLALDGWTLHVLASHPTPPVFDGPEDRNGRRNADEIRFWIDYLDAALDPDPSAPRQAYLVDDQGRQGGLPPGASFIVLGDLNADPADRSHERSSIADLLAHRLISPVVPRAMVDPPPAREGYEGDDRARTAAFGRVDYAQPSRDLEVVGSGVFMPAADDPARAYVAGGGESGGTAASDHYLVWVDLRPPLR